MERPKVEVTPKEREITGEIMYLDQVRRSGSEVKTWPDDISDMAIQMYEAEADMAREHGVRPAILDEYEKYDREIDPLAASCVAMADELLKLKRPDSSFTFEDFVVTMPVEEVHERLRSIRAGEVLADDDEQLAFSSDGTYYPILDIKKKDMQLDGVGLRVFGWSEHKYRFTNEPGEKYNYPQDYLEFPSNEKSKWYSFEVVFFYRHPEAGAVNEEVALSVGQRGSLDIHRQVWASAYAETGYEGHSGKGLSEATDEDIAEFADLIAEMVDDEPEAIWQHNERALTRYIDSVPSELARTYLSEWLHNTWAGQVLADLQYTGVEGKRLSYALKNSELSDRALEVLATKVEEHRARHNELAADTKRSMELLGRETEPWHDLVDRQAQS